MCISSVYMMTCAISFLPPTYMYQAEGWVAFENIRLQETHDLKGSYYERQAA